MKIIDTIYEVEKVVHVNIDVTCDYFCFDTDTDHKEEMHEYFVNANDANEFVNREFDASSFEKKVKEKMDVCVYEDDCKISSSNTTQKKVNDLDKSTVERILRENPNYELKQVTYEIDNQKFKKNVFVEKEQQKKFA